MSGLFVFGTLRHLPLLGAVIGRDTDSLDIRRAWLPDHAVQAVEGEGFPCLMAEPGTQAEGLLIGGLTREDWARIDFYEGGFGYGLHGVRVLTDDGEEHPARAYFTDDPRWRAAGSWDLDGWSRREGEIAALAATEELRHFGTPDGGRADALRFAFRARAWARILARQNPVPLTRRSPMTDADVVHFEERGGYDGFFRLSRFDLKYRRFRGGESDVLRREAFVAFDAAMVLPYDPVRDRVLLVEQVRFGPLLRGDPAPWVLEPVAGLVDAGEDPAETARREAREEAHLDLGPLERMAGVYPSSGYSTEYFHCFLGVCDLEDPATAHAGLASENEDIRTHILDVDEALGMVDSGEINVGVTVMMLLWLARYRARDHANA